MKRTPAVIHASRIAAGMAAAVLFAAGPALAEQEKAAGHEHMQHDSAKPATQAEMSEASKAYEAAMQKMHKDMMVPYTNDVDVDFVKGMIPHHQGAIDMAKIVLEHGKDPKVKKLARDIIKAQEREIAMMKSWLAQKKQ